MKNSRKKQKITDVKLVDLAKSFWKSGKEKSDVWKTFSKWFWQRVGQLV